MKKVKLLQNPPKIREKYVSRYILKTLSVGSRSILNNTKIPQI